MDIHAVALLEFALIMQTSSSSVQEVPTITSELFPMKHLLRLILPRHVFFRVFSCFIKWNQLLETFSRYFQIAFVFGAYFRLN